MSAYTESLKKQIASGNISVKKTKTFAEEQEEKREKILSQAKQAQTKKATAQSGGYFDTPSAVADMVNAMNKAKMAGGGGRNGTVNSISSTNDTKFDINPSDISVDQQRSADLARKLAASSVTLSAKDVALGAGSGAISGLSGFADVGGIIGMGNAQLEKSGLTATKAVAEKLGLDSIAAAAQNKLTEMTADYGTDEYGHRLNANGETANPLFRLSRNMKETAQDMLETASKDSTTADKYLLDYIISPAGNMGATAAVGGAGGKVLSFALGALAGETAGAAANIGGKIGSRSAQVIADSAGTSSEVISKLANYTLKNSRLLGMSASAGGNNYEQAKLDGATEAQAIAYGVITGAVEAGTEKLFGGNPVFDSDKAGFVNRVIAKAGGSAKLLKFLDSVPVETFNEGLEEIIANYGYTVAQEITGQKANLPTAQENIGSFASGVALGALGQGANAVFKGALQNKASTNEITGIAPHETGSQPAQASNSTAQTSNGATSPVTQTAAKISATSLTSSPIVQTILNPQNAKTPVETSAGDTKANSKEVILKLKSSIPEIENDVPVTTLTGKEFLKADKKLTDQVSDFFKSLGNAVTRNGFGTVILNRGSAKSDIAHGIGRAKAATFAAVPDVIAGGKQIDYQPNWKGLGYDSYVFAAPVNIGAKRSYVAAVVLKSNDNHFYLHEVVDENGNIIYIKKDTSGGIKNGVAIQDGVTVAPEASSYNIISQPGKNINSVSQETRKAAIMAKIGTQHISADGISRESADAVNSLIDAGKLAVDAKGEVYAANPADTIDNRDSADMGDRKINAYQYDHPWAHDYYSNAAKILRDDISDSTKGERFFIDAFTQSEPIVKGVKRSTTPEIEELLDSGDFTWKSLGKAVDDIINNHGMENNAAAKRLELMLDRMLTDGYTTMRGEVITPNTQYIADKAESERANELGAANLGFDQYGRMGEQYGTIAQGERAARDVQMPAQTAEGNRVSQGARTAAEAVATPDARLQDISDAVVDGKFSYVPIKNAELEQNAADDINNKGWAQALSDWKAAAAKGDFSDQLIAEGAVLLNNAGNSNMTGKEYIDLVADYVRMTRSAGKALQANRILKTLTPDGQLYMIERSAQHITDDLQLKTGIQIDEGLVDEFRNAGTDEERNAAIDKIINNIASQIPATKLDKWTAWRYTAMLGNLKTQVRNVAGNTANWAAKAVKDRVKASIEVIANKATGGKVKRTTSFVVNPTSKLYREAAEDWEANKNDAMGEGKYSDYLGNTDATVREIMNRRRIFSTKAIEAYRNFTNTMMEKGDTFFNSKMYAGALAGYLKANGVKHISEAPVAMLDDARAYAIRQAQEGTFRDSNLFSDAVSKLGARWVKSKNPAERFAGAMFQGVLPFRRTPANALVRAEEYSPLGIINTAAKAVQAAKGTATANDVIEQLSKTLTGSGIFALGIILHSMGLLRGADDDDKKQAAFDDLLGHQSYALELPDGKSFTLDWLNPECIPLFMGAAMSEALDDDGFQPADIWDSVMSITDPMLQMSMLQGLNDALENVANNYDDTAAIPKLAAQSLISYVAQGLAPTLAGQIERSTEDNRMTTYTDKNGVTPAWLQYQLGKISAKTPGIDYKQTEYIDAWGRTENNGDVLARTINNLINPAYVSEVNTDSVDNELQKVADAAGDTGVFPASAEKTITINGESKTLTAAQHETYAKNLGRTSYTLVQQAISSTGYKSLDAEGKADMIKDMYSYAKAKAKQSVYPSAEMTEPNAAYKTAESRGISPAQWYTVKNTVSDMTAKDASGKSVSGLKKQRVTEYINGTNLTREQRAWFLKDIMGYKS